MMIGQDIPIADLPYYIETKQLIRLCKEIHNEYGKGYTAHPHFQWAFTELMKRWEDKI